MKIGPTPPLYLQPTAHKDMYEQLEKCVRQTSDGNAGVLSGPHQLGENVRFYPPTTLAKSAESWPLLQKGEEQSGIKAVKSTLDKMADFPDKYGIYLEGGLKTGFHMLGFLATIPEVWEAWCALKTEDAEHDQ